MSLGEIVLLLVVGIIVVGPRNLPTMMRTAGQWVARIRRMTMDLRSQSGIDDILRKEGLDEHIHQLRSLSRLNVVESLIAPVGAKAAGAALDSPYVPPSPAPSPPVTPLTPQQIEHARNAPLREREYPLIGCDSYEALPDDAVTYRMMAANKAVEAPALAPVATSPEPVKDDVVEGAGQGETAAPGDAAKAGAGASADTVEAAKAGVDASAGAGEAAKADGAVGAGADTGDTGKADASPAKAAEGHAS